MTKVVDGSIKMITETPTSGDVGIGKTVSITLTSSEAVSGSGGTAPTLTLNDGGVAVYDAAKSTSTSFVFDYTAKAGENTESLAATSINLNGAAVKDAAGNPINLSLAGLAQKGPQIDTKRPTITSVNETPSTGDLGIGKTVAITLTTSEAVFGSGGTGPTLTLNDGGVATYDAAKSTTTSFVFDYTAKAGENTESLAATSVNLNGATAKDAAGNPINLSLAGLAQKGPQIDTKRPTITSVNETPSTGDLGIGKTVAITLTTSEAVFGSGGTGPTLTLNDGGVATYDAAKSTTTSFVFDYTVAAGQHTDLLQVLSVNLNGATVADEAGNAPDLSLAGLTQKGPQIDKSASIQWIGATADWTTAFDWSTGQVPGATNDVAIAQGAPQINTNVGTVDTVVNSTTLVINDRGILTTIGNFSNSGAVSLTNNDALVSSLVVGGALTNSSGAEITITNSRLADLPVEIQAASLSNEGNISILNVGYGSDLIDITGTAGFGTAGVLTGLVSLAGYATIEFGSGQIGSIATGGELDLVGSGAFVADAANTFANSALMGLSSNAGDFNLAAGASVETTGGFTNSGFLSLGALPISSVFFGLTDATQLTIGEALTNSSGANITIGAADSLSTNEIQAASLVNKGTIFLAPGYATSSLAITGAAENDGSITTAYGDITIIGGDVTGSGSFTIGSGATLELGGANAETVNFVDASATLTLDESTKFAGQITGLTATDILDLKDIDFGSNLTLGYSGNPSGGTLSVSDGAHVAKIALLGNYFASSFVAANDGHGGTLISDQPSSQQTLLTLPLHAAG